MRNLYFRLLMVLLALYGPSVYATHYLGGEMTYAALGNNRYRVTVRIYRDCHPSEPTASQQDLPLFFSVFTASGLKSFSDSISGSFQPLFFTRLPGCYHDTIANYCVEYAELQKIITLPPSPDGYIIANQRCCMVDYLINITDPGSHGLTLSCDVPGIDLIGAGIGNSSPVFRTLPPVRVCRNTTFNIDFSATDADGDSLAYRLVSCLQEGRQIIQNL